MTGTKHIETYTEAVFAVDVRFMQQGAWSSSYRYISKKKYAKDSIVLVPNSAFYNVGKVFKCTEGIYEDLFRGDFEYKQVIKEVLID
jgi:hypothetical protein